MKSPRALIGLHVLLVDDDVSVREIVGEYLRHGGAAFEVVTTAEEALLRLAAVQFDVLITDLRLPGMNGAELLRLLAGRVPAVVLTGYADDTLALEAVRAGALQVVEKPFHHDDLIAAIREAAGPLERESGTLALWLECRDVSRANALPRLPARIARLAALAWGDEAATAIWASEVRSLIAQAPERFSVRAEADEATLRVWLNDDPAPSLIVPRPGHYRAAA